jgi:hypothetical protein
LTLDVDPAKPDPWAGDEERLTVLLVCAMGAWEIEGREDAMGPHVLALYKWDANPGVLARPLEYQGTPAVFGRNKRLWNIADKDGTVWVIISSPRSRGSGRLYRLAYKMVDCQALERRTPWGKFGVAGDPGASIPYGSNDAETVLMSLRFKRAAPIESRGRIAYRIGMKQELSDEGIDRLERFAAGLARTWRVFISYSHDPHEDDATWLEQELDLSGKSVFRDGGALRAGQLWNEKIIQAIDGARYFVVLCSDAAAGSDYVRDEVGRAMARPRNKFTIIPVVMPGADMNRWQTLDRFHHIAWDPDRRDRALNALLAAMTE